MESFDSADGGELAGIKVTRVQPYQAAKTYRCPGCEQGIAAGVGHLVIVPTDLPEDRRHWHSACWSFRHRRRPGSASPRLR